MQFRQRIVFAQEIRRTQNADDRVQGQNMTNNLIQLVMYGFIVIQDTVT